MLCITSHQTFVAKVRIADDRGACPWLAVFGVMARLLVGDMQGAEKKCRYDGGEFPSSRREVRWQELPRHFQCCYAAW